MNKLFSVSQIANFMITQWGPLSYKSKRWPFAVCLFVTDRCNLSCKWCLRQTDNKFMSEIRPDMSLDTAKKILQYFPVATHLSLAGFGEPLLVNNLFAICNEFRKRPMRVSLISNGTLLIDRLDELLRSGINRVSISINSLNTSDYQSTCGGNENTFNNIVKGIQLLAKKRKSKKPYLQISFVLTRKFFDRTQEIIDFAEELNVDSLSLHNLIANNNNDYNDILTHDDDEVVSKLSEWSKKKYKVRVDWPRLVQPGLLKPMRICKPCWTWLGVDMEGNTAGCSKAMPTNKKFGNLFQEGKNIWNNEFREKLRMNFTNRDNFLYDCCKTCALVQP